jgi:hypothetical protein
VLVPEEELPALRRQLALVLTTPGQKEDRVARALALLDMNRQQAGDTVADRRVASLVRGTRPAERARALQTLESLPGGPAARSEERLRLAQLYEAAGNWPRAREQYVGLVRSDAGNPTWLVLLVEALLRAGDKSEAGRWFAELEKRHAKDPRTIRLREQLRKPAGQAQPSARKGGR